MFRLMGLSCPVRFTHVCPLILLWLGEDNWGIGGRRELFWWGTISEVIRAVGTSRQSAAAETWARMSAFGVGDGVFFAAICFPGGGPAERR